MVLLLSPAASGHDMAGAISESLQRSSTGWMGADSEENVGWDARCEQGPGAGSCRCLPTYPEIRGRENNWQRKGDCQLFCSLRGLLQIPVPPAHILGFVNKSPPIIPQALYKLLYLRGVVCYAVSLRVGTVSYALHPSQSPVC